MPYAGHNANILSQPMSSVGKYKRRFANGSYPISSVQSVTDTPCIRFSPEGAVSYTIVENDQTDSDSRPPILTFGKRAFYKTRNWLKRPNTLRFPPVESTTSQRTQIAMRRNFRWTLQTSTLPRPSARPSLRRSRCDSSTSEFSAASWFSGASTSSQSSTSDEGSEDVPIVNGRLSQTTLALKDTLPFHQTTITKRSTLVLTPSSRHRNLDDVFVSPDSAPPFADTFGFYSEDEKDTNCLNQEDWDGKWNNGDMKEVQAKLRKLRMM